MNPFQRIAHEAEQNMARVFQDVAKSLASLIDARGLANALHPAPHHLSKRDEP